MKEGPACGMDKGEPEVCQQQGEKRTRERETWATLLLAGKCALRSALKGTGGAKKGRSRVANGQ